MRRSQPKMEKLVTANAVDPKWLSLSCFVLQNSLLIIGLKACTIYSSHSMNQYIASTAVILSEVLKFILSAVACYVIDAKCNFATFCDLIYNMVMEEGADSLKLCVPALLYTIQNNLQYIIEEAPLFLVLYQAKIVTTAVFYSTLLSRRLSTKEWACIVALALGVSMVESSQVEIVPNHASNITGVAAVVFACLSSGVAGVSFEKILKSSRSSIWMINMQMSLLSAFFCTSVALTQDSVEIVHHGVFTGYNPLVLLSIVLQAITGLAVALVVKYADNLYKGFGHSISLVFCNSLSSMVFEDTSVNETFLLGSFLVLASSAAYASVTAGQTTGAITPASHVRDRDGGREKDKDRERTEGAGFISSASAGVTAVVNRASAQGAHEPTGGGYIALVNLDSGGAALSARSGQPSSGLGASAAPADGASSYGESAAGEAAQRQELQQQQLAEEGRVPFSGAVDTAAGSGPTQAAGSATTSGGGGGGWAGALWGRAASAVSSRDRDS